MKATVKVMLPGYTGNMNDITFYFNRKLNCMVARKKVMPKFVPSHEPMQQIFAFARRIGLSEAYKQDCNLYIDRYNQKNRKHHRAHSSWPSIFAKLMFAQLIAKPDLDLTTLTRDAAIAQNLPCRSIAASIQAGLLEKVRDGEMLTNPI
ncbi:MAG: hypothetical protein Q8M98_11555 [Candidatus Cloacimonadaceae bacterium]|nr:hypothetical protein [Candidatus Cloacimonadaceae bacterium]